MDPKQFKTQLLEALGPFAGLVPCGSDSVHPGFLLELFKMFVQKCEYLQTACKTIRDQQSQLLEVIKIAEDYEKERDAARQEVCELRASKLATTEEEYETLKKQIALNNCWDGIFENTKKEQAK